MTTPPAEDVNEVPARPARRRLLPTGFSTLRDIFTFALGTGIVCNEVFLANKVEMTAIAIGAAMMGLPLVFNADERRKGTPAPPPGSGG